jgi:hypothetical protein
LHWERRFLTAGIPPHQYLGMLLSNQPLMSDLYALDTLQFQRNGMIYPLLAYLPDSKPASQTRSISEKLGTIIDRSLTIILERKLLACGLDFKPVDRSCLHQRQMLRSINAQLTSLSAEFKKSNDGKQLRQLLGRLEASSMVLGVDEARQMDALLKTWQRWKYLQTISNPVNSVRLKELRAATISSGSYAALIILPRSHLFAMERRLK